MHKPGNDQPALNKLIVISAPSGAGKTTLCERLLRDFPVLKLSVSSTTRAPRGQEAHGKAYYFMTKEEFEKGIRSNHFAEWATVHGNYYGTSKQFIEETFKQGFSVLLDIDVQGAASLRKAFPKNYFSAFISPPSIEELEARLRRRGTDSEETIQKRIRNARAEMECKDQFDIIIINDSLDRAYLELKAAIAKTLGTT